MSRHSGHIHAGASAGTEGVPQPAEREPAAEHGQAGWRELAGGRPPGEGGGDAHEELRECGGREGVGDAHGHPANVGGWTTPNGHRFDTDFVGFAHRSPRTWCRRTDSRLTYMDVTLPL